MAKKKGGQPNNKNALKHGLWAKRGTTKDKRLFSNIPIKDIEGEVFYLKTLASRIAIILEENGLGNLDDKLKDNIDIPLPTDDTIKLLYAFDMIMRRLLTYTKTQVLFAGDLTALEKEIEEGRRLARLDMNVYSYFQYNDNIFTEDIEENADTD